MTAKGGLFIVDVEADCLFGRSAKGVREARIARTGCVHFLMQACRLIVYYDINEFRRCFQAYHRDSNVLSNLTLLRKSFCDNHLLCI
jgi:hypothetical protein